ncbi:Cys-tRNA(Pro) deacylase [Labedella gwakjiensis]|uniref:Cys-tRNA(Pro) deacylase n=2 Tax=Labedella gwakjiensis TaxID=390269 RepID=A0A2P8H079_9MICO|nr:Cys-tRNA(Pro) deacylase [Labedella gwakjiensis]
MAQPNEDSPLSGEGRSDRAVEKVLRGTESMRAHADALGLDVDVVTRPAARSLAEAAEMLGISPGDIVKSLVVRRSDGDYLFALVPGGRKIDWAKLRAAVGTNRLSLPDAEQAKAATGYERGTITPLGSTTAWPVFADERVQGHRVALGGGAHGLSTFVDGDALLSALDATVADITGEE